MGLVTRTNCYAGHRGAFQMDMERPFCLATATSLRFGVRQFCVDARNHVVSQFFGVSLGRSVAPDVRVRGSEREVERETDRSAGGRDGSNGVYVLLQSSGCLLLIP